MSPLTAGIGGSMAMALLHRRGESLREDRAERVAERCGGIGGKAGGAPADVLVGPHEHRAVVLDLRDLRPARVAVVKPAGADDERVELDPERAAELRRRLDPSPAAAAG